MTKPHNTKKTIGIVGLGLIGGSLGLSLQKLGYFTYGIANNSKNSKRAAERGLANIVSEDFQILNKCQIIILALPIKSLLEPDERLLKSLPKESIVTDVGSVKKIICEKWQNYHPNFVGSHPMAGTNQSGVESGINNLFLNKPWVCTPTQKTNTKALEQIKNIARDLQCKWICTDASSHDKAVALISHLPILVSAALLKTLSLKENSSINELALMLASTGFLSTSRVGGGNPELGLSIIQNNTSSLIDCLDNYNYSLKNIKELIRTKSWDVLLDELKEANKQYFEINKS